MSTPTEDGKAVTFVNPTRCPSCDKNWLDNLGRCGSCDHGWRYAMNSFEIKAQSDELNTGISAHQPTGKMVGPDRGGDKLIQTEAELKAAFPRPDMVNHPFHYGGKDDPYEAIKVIEAWKLGFNLGNVLKYIRRFGGKPGDDPVEVLEKARWYLDREITNLKDRSVPQVGSGSSQSVQR